MDTSSSAGRKLSVAMIVRDAEATVAAALDSVRAIADEIVVVDTGSTDRTREVARPRASKFVERPWEDDFSGARNFALSQITGDWVLWLDASEQLEANSARSIRTKLDSQNDCPQAFLSFVQLPAGPGQVDGERVARVRLWPTKTNLRFAGRVREQLSPAPESIGLAVHATDWQILRSACDVDPSVRAAKARRDIRLAELEIDQHGERLSLLLGLGDAWAALGEPLKAAGCFRRVIDDAPTSSTEQLEAYYGLLTSFDGQSQLRDEQIATCVQALEIFPLDAQLLCAMGSYLQGQGRLDLACRSYQMAVEHGQINLRAWHLANLADVATICYCLTLDLMGRSDAAQTALENALAARGPSERLRRQLIDLLVRHNRRQDALAQADLLGVEVIQRDALRNAIRGACLAAAGQTSNALAYLRTAYDTGCRDPICLRWLASSLLAVGQAEAAEPILRQWQAAMPANPEPVNLLKMLNQQGPPVPHLQFDSARSSLAGAAN